VLVAPIWAAGFDQQDLGLAAPNPEQQDALSGGGIHHARGRRASLGNPAAAE
jgi:hypothetical protein